MICKLLKYTLRQRIVGFGDAKVPRAEELHFGNVGWWHWNPDAWTSREQQESFVKSGMSQTSLHRCIMEVARRHAI